MIPGAAMSSPIAVAPEPHELPEYAGELAAFHQAFLAELTALIALLPLAPNMSVLDVGCGDGFFTGLFADRLIAPGAVVGLDISSACLALARRHIATRETRCDVSFVAGDLAELPVPRAGFDLVWCAQSLYSLPDPVEAVRQMSIAAKPGGLVAVFENDTLHQLLLPWPGRLEIALRGAEYAALAAESPRPGRYYVGRRLPAVLAAAGLEPLVFRTQCIDRQAPIDRALEFFLHSYLQRLVERVGPRLARQTLHELKELIDPDHSAYLPRQPHFTLSWLNVLAWGRQPVR
jgi:ubiquinone/menaquinone biosynthesis C-methylase UbiE